MTRRVGGGLLGWVVGWACVVVAMGAPIDVSEDGSGSELVEPLDAAEAAGEAGPARAVELVLPADLRGEEISVEWRRFGAWGEGTVLVAARRIAVPATVDPAGGARVVVPVAVAEDRLLRLRRLGGAPETFYVPAADSEDLVDVELAPTLPVVGGEVVGFVETPDFRPVALALAGIGEASGGERVPVGFERSSFFVASGIAPGRHRLVAIYRGGVEVWSPPFEVRAGQSTEWVPWELPPRGALDVGVDESLCLEVDELVLLAEPVESAEPNAAPRYLGLPRDRCDARFEGLAPGRWRLSLVDAALLDTALLNTPSAGRAVTLGEPLEIEIEPGALAGIVFEGSSSWLEGVVGLSAEQPLADLVVRALLPMDEEEAVDAVPAEPVPLASSATDATGRYRLELPFAGPVTLEITTARGVLVLRRAVDLVSGANRLDIDLGDAALRLRVARADGQVLDEAVSIELRRAGEEHVVRTVVAEPAVSEAGIDEALLVDLQPTAYDVSAFTTSGWVTASRQTAELSKSAPIAEIALVLERRRAVAVVRDLAGRAVPGVLVALDRRPLQPDSGRSTDYPLVGAGDGAQLRVQPPPSHVPVCRVIRGAESLEIVLQPSAGEAVLIPPTGGTPPVGTVLGMLDGLPESECPMPVSLMWEPFVDEHGRERIRIVGLPEGTFMLHGPSGSVSITVPGPEVPFGG
ncbi:MAG: hypothetical protein AAGC60_00825 [Acidobacteriota bacterium]